MVATPPKIFAIRATAAAVAAVIVRRGPWMLLARWDLATAKVEPGAWFRGTIKQRRCDLSPDGSLFYYFALKGGRPFHAVSRLPWLTALALWKDNTTYGSGAHFEPLPSRGSNVAGTFREPPDQGTLLPLATQHRLRLIYNSGLPYDVERRRGWVEHANAAPLIAGDHFHERRHQWLVCNQPTGSARLELRDVGYQRGHLEGRAPTYTLDGEPLEGVTWADWDPRGRLLVATHEGTLEIRDARNRVRASTSLAGIEPDPRPPPPRAARW
jgi:hypothetical protein